MNPAPIFTPAAWHQPAPGTWEAQATPTTVDGHPPFEAVCWQLAGHAWTYRTYHANADGTQLNLVGDGTAKTLNAAQRGAEQTARLWRNHATSPPQHRSPAGYTAYTVVVCDTCGTHQQLEHILMAGRCLGDRNWCDSDSFDGHPVDHLAEAVTQ